MRRIILTFLLALLVFVHGSAQAQATIKLSSVTVNIWPEYDQPAVLVVYGFLLASDTQLPANLTIHIPSNSQINAVAVVDPDKGLVNAPYNNSIEGQWETLNISTSSLQVQIEYYTALNKQGSSRHIEYEWYGDFAVDQFDANFLAPFGAQNVQLNVAPTDINPGQDSLTNYHIRESNLSAGSPFLLNIDYDRNTDDLSISSLPVEAASTPGADTSGRVSMTGVLPWIFGGLGVLLILAGVFGFIIWQRGSEVSHVKKRIPARESKKEESDDSIYCHQCGNRAQPGDVFCRTCGTLLKRE